MVAYFMYKLVRIPSDMSMISNKMEGFVSCIKIKNFKKSVAVDRKSSNLYLGNFNFILVI